MAVHRFTPNDYEDVERLHRSLGSSSDLRESTVRLLENPAGRAGPDLRAYVLKDDHRIIGLACLERSPGAAGGGEIARLELSLPAGVQDAVGSDLVAAAHADAPPEAAIHAETTEHSRLLELCGYRVAKVNVHLAVNLDEWDAPPLDSPYRFRPYTEIEDDAGKFAELHALITRALEDVPRAVPRRSWSFDEFLAHRRTSTELLPALSVVASDNDELVAFTELKKTSEKGTVLSSLTGVHPDYRGRHLSREVKRQALAAAKRAGFSRVVTQNARTNEAMIRANRTLGFVPTHSTYECLFTPEQRHG